MIDAPAPSAIPPATAIATEPLPASERPAWSPFEELREWNAQAGRIATLASFLLAAIVATGYRALLDRYDVGAATGDGRAILVVVVGILAQTFLGLAFLFVIWTLWEVVPSASDAEHLRTAVMAKRRRARWALIALIAALLGFIFTQGLDQMESARVAVDAAVNPSIPTLIYLVSLLPILLISWSIFIVMIISSEVIKPLRRPPSRRPPQK